MWHALPYQTSTSQNIFNGFCQSWYRLCVYILNSKSIICRIFPLVGTWSPFRFGHCDPAHPTGSTGGHFGSAQLPHIGPGSFTLPWSKIDNEFTEHSVLTWQTAPEGQHRLSWLRWPEGTLGAVFCGRHWLVMCYWLAIFIKWNNAPKKQTQRRRNNL